MIENLPGDLAAQAAVNTINTLAAIYVAGRLVFLTLGSLCILFAIFLTVQHKPPQYSSREIGPYNPKFDPLQKKQQESANKWRFLAIVIFIFGIAPWILEFLVFSGAV